MIVISRTTSPDKYRMCDMKSSDKSRSTFVAQQMLSDKSRMFVIQHVQQ